MGILNSLISLAVIVTAGYITITYIIPKIEGTSTSGGKDDAKKIVEDIAGVVSGETPPASESEPEVPKEETKKKKKPYDPSKGMAGKGESKKKKKKGSGEEKSKNEMLYAYFNYGETDSEWDY